MGSHVVWFGTGDVCHNIFDGDFVQLGQKELVYK
jgi:hypothetical protein